MAVSLLVVASISLAQTTFEDPQGRFAIDLPKGWQLDPQQEDALFVFKGDGKSIIIEYVSGVNDAGALMKKAQATLVASGLTNPVLDGDLMDMTINGHPARYELSESRIYYPYKKARNVNTFLIAQPVKIPSR